MRSLLQGLAAGFLATVPMTVFMRTLHRQLPWHERYQLPPAQITAKTASQAGLKPETDNRRWDWKTYLSHFGFGTAAGGVFGGMTRQGRASATEAAVTGCLYGTLVWAASYLGWLPAVGILPPATREPARRNAIMLGAHWVWGASLGLLVREMQSKKPRITPRRTSAGVRKTTAPVASR